MDLGANDSLLQLLQGSFEASAYLAITFCISTLQNTFNRFAGRLRISHDYYVKYLWTYCKGCKDKNDCELTSMSKRFKHCILHIGTEKTGTSTIQTFLNENRDELKDDGIFYPETQLAGSQWEFVALSHPKPWEMDIGRKLNIGNASEKASFQNIFIENLNTQFLSKTDAETLVLSSEHFQSRLISVEMIEALKAILDQWVDSYKVIVYFRRQDELAVSHYTTRVKSGYQGKDVFLPKTGESLLYFEYDKLVERWSEVFGKGNIGAGLYAAVKSQPNGLLLDFCRLANINYKDKTFPAWENKSISVEGLKFIQSINRYYDGNEELESQLEKAQIIDITSNTNNGKFYPISKAVAKAFYLQFEDSNNRLQKTIFPNLPLPLFKEDFLEYPDEAEAIPDSYDDAVIQAINLWRQSKQPLTLRKIASSLKSSLNPRKIMTRNHSD